MSEIRTKRWRGKNLQWIYWLSRSNKNIGLGSRVLQKSMNIYCVGFAVLIQVKQSFLHITRLPKIRTAVRLKDSCGCSLYQLYPTCALQDFEAMVRIDCVFRKASYAFECICRGPGLQTTRKKKMLLEWLFIWRKWWFQNMLCLWDFDLCRIPEISWKGFHALMY